ncbi:Short-chain dehydrogenase, associated with 2-hydroxychromene-2-carboxylate isomerase family protein [Labilithrix luteola]|uniref:Short-chain dehydrogenase, associated with 2-hydroxychromene-2-carboxylate isomerase family protein n=1 Tax=Labilithrix luteola TaxID=1391654 RepID=A0A0K1PVS6_9BACT|nr:SDR family NAD(P)-dependent oxidoreductase [Labilithrix luteola]AKU97486.1 Short-chain dehydrogenase, associated with 2-hydroxychromene-2-carboxylate isomerase family protein [Labilithrix luteola]
MGKKGVCAVVGIGPGNGAALARRFAKDGYAVALLARSPGLTNELAKELDGARAYLCDVADEASIKEAFAAIRKHQGEVDVLVYNAGSGIWGSVEEITPEGFEQSWRVNALGALVASQEVIPSMKAKGRGNIVFIGATASRRGNVMTAAFAPAKAAQRSLAESMARSLWPAGIHVSVVIVDGVVDLPSTRKRMPDKPDSFFIRPDDVADLVHSVTEQKPSTWSFEVEARPFAEKW